MKIHIGSADHGPLFALLVIMALTAAGTSFLHLPPLVNNTIVLAIASVMAVLVVGQYMGLRFKGQLAVWVFFAPALILFLILVVMMLPDIAHIPFAFLGKL